MPTSAWRPAGVSSRPSLPAASHRRPPPPTPRPRDGPWGAPGAPGPVQLPPAPTAPTSAASACACMSAGGMHRGVDDAELPAEVADGAPLRVSGWRRGARAPASTCPAFPQGRRATAFRSLELSGEELWHAADAVRQRVEALRRTASECGRSSSRSRTSCGRTPTRCSNSRAVGPKWAARGGRALHALRACIPSSPEPGGTLAIVRVRSYSPRGTS